jgi:hypothetical protein
MNGIVRHILSIVDPAKKLMSLAITLVCGEYLAKSGGRFIDSTLLKKGICLGCVGKQKASAKKEENPKGNVYTGRRSRDEHD